MNFAWLACVCLANEIANCFIQLSRCYAASPIHASSLVPSRNIRGRA